MADRQQNLIPDDPEFTGGWHKPQSPGGWRTPDTPSENVGAWREPTRVTLPEDMNMKPAAEGGWHLPKPEDTEFTTEGESEVTAETTSEAAPPEADLRPEDMLESGSSTAAPALPLQTDDDDFDSFSMSELVALASLVEQAPQPDILPGSAAPARRAAPQEEVRDVTASKLSPAERAAFQAAGVRTEPLTDLPLSGTVPGASEGLTPELERLRGEEPEASTGRSGVHGGEPSEGRRDVERLSAREAGDITTQGEATGAYDPAAYAREQLARIQGGQTGASQPQPAAEPASDPSAYAREPLARIQGGQPAASQPVASQPVAPALSAQQQELAQKYRETERQVAALRQMNRAGQITQDQLREQLSQLLVLDESRVWWMMGLETDGWYRYDNTSSQWILDTPPVLASAAAAPVSQGDPGMAFDRSLPQFASEPVQSQSPGYTQPSGAYATPVQQDIFGRAIDEDPLPRQVPVQDPDQTMVGQRAPYMDDVRQSEAMTQPGMGRFTQATVPGGAYVEPGMESIPSARPGYDAGAPNYAEQLGRAAPRADEVAEQERQQRIGLAVRLAAVLVALVALSLACGAGFILINYSNIANQYQPQIAALAAYQPAFQTVRILDAKDQLIAVLNSEDGGARTTVPIGQVSPFMVHAVIALENERFFEDPGWDPIAIGRAFIQNVGAGGIESGASTITQQIARQLVLHNTDVTLGRKIDEVVIAGEIGKQYSKEFILQLYLNEIYFGNQAYGVEAAAQFYFGHGAADLNLVESAFLAGLIQSPAIYDPVPHSNETREETNVRRNAAFARMDEVLKRMQEVGCLDFPGTGISTPPGGFCITADIVRAARIEIATAKARTFQARTVDFQYPHFVQFVRDMVNNRYGEGTMFRQGFTIRTTLNSAIQDEAIRDLQLGVNQYSLNGVNTGAIMVTDPNTGAILAMVGGPDFNNAAIAGQVNNTLTWQQPGSSIKPVVYTAALEGRDLNGDGVADQYLTPASILWDVPTTYTNVAPPYSPVNFDGAFRGPISVRYALQNSINIAAIKVYDFIGADRFRDTATRMGLQFLENAQFGLPTAVGATEVTLYNMMEAYGTLAANGTRHDLYAIRSITASDGTDAGWPVPPEATRAISPALAFIMQNILSDDVARADVFGQGGPMTVPGYPASGFVAAKTGTSNDARDLWTMGFTRNAVVGIWMGRHDDQPTQVRAASIAAAPIWQRVMQYTLSTMPPTSAFSSNGVPGLREYQVCVDTGTLPPSNCTGLRSEIFLDNQPPAGADQAFVRQIQIDSWTGLIANEKCPTFTTTQTYVNIQDAAALQWLAGAGRAVAQRLQLPSQILPAPTAACDQNTEVPIALFNYPSDGLTLTEMVQINGTATATSTFGRYQLDAVSTTTGQAFSIVPAATSPVLSGILGTWDTRSVPNGTYTLRLQMFSTNAYAGNVERTVTVNVNNAIPTAVIPPTANPLLPTPLSPNEPTPTALPFSP
ncbi:MAG: transglycosylase domain-containing protein [Anaerolineae bacterium]|nr:transglycosylase domain-containing protein [Anaerolineae bacterium]